MYSKKALNSWFFLFLLIPLSSLAQKSSISEDIDKYDQAILNNIAKHDQKSLAKNYELKATSLQRYSIPATIEYLKKALVILEELSDKEGVTRVTSAIANAYWQSENYDNALVYNYKLLAIYEKNKDSTKIAQTHSMLASLYDERSDNKRAYEHNLKALKIATQINSERGIAALLNNIAANYKNMDSVELALKCVYKAVRINKKLDNEDWLSINYTTLADIHDQLFNYDSVKYYLDKSQLYVEKSGSSADSIALLRKLGVYYIHVNKLDQAIVNFNKGILLSRRIGSLKSEANFIHWLSEVYEKKGQFDLAMVYLQTHFELLDSLKKMENSEVVEALNIQYGLREIEDSLNTAVMEGIIVKKDVSRKNTLLLILSAIVTLFCIFGVIMYLQLKKQARTNKHLLRLNMNSSDVEMKAAEKKYIQSSLSDTTKNDILERFITLMHENELFKQQEITLNQVADKLNISRTYLSQVINETYSQNFNAYINQCRINLSKKFLVSDEYDKYSINGIAEMVGFKSLSSFNASFKKITGLTPSYYRKQGKLNQ